MYCYQCEETINGQSCTKAGACGKTADVADLQDQLIYILKGIAYYNQKARENGIKDKNVDSFLMKGLFSTVTNTNFSSSDFNKFIKEGISLRESVKKNLTTRNIDLGETKDLSFGEKVKATLGVSHPETRFTIPEAAIINTETLKTASVGVLTTQNEDIRSLRELLVYGLKGLAAYAHHAEVLGYTDETLSEFAEKALVATLDDSLSVDDLVGLVLECGKYGVNVMALLDKANTTTYGNPEPTEVFLGTRDNPGILISGHDLKDMEQLLKQTEGTGVDVYTHGEMLPANCYPAFKKYDHFVGNYGGSWWNQKSEFETFNGPILMTTNCLVPPKASYINRVYTTSVVGFDGVKHIDAKEDGTKDFSAIVDQAIACQPPEQLEDGTIVGGFAHAAVLSVADKVIEAVKAGKITRFIVMAGCDGRHKERDYYTKFAEALPESAVILTAGCAKYRYNKLNLGDIDGIPRVLDAGQCNDSYSLVVIAQKLAEAFGLEDINELPVSYNIAWYEQKAVLVLLALLHLGVKNITLGPTLPAFVSPNVLNVLVENFNISPNTTVEEDLKRLL